MTDVDTFEDRLKARGLIKPTPEPPPRPVVVHLDANRGDITSYAARALNDEVTRVATAANGTRNNVLNRAGYSLGQLVGGGVLEENLVRVSLTEAARVVGLDDVEITRTLDSAIPSGAAEPRGIPARDPSTPPALTPFDDADVDAIKAYIEANLQRLDWHALWADQSEEEWIVEPILPARRLVALYSAPKVGKSLLMLEVAVAIATGRPVLGARIDRPRRVLYVDFENDPKADVRERLQAMRVGPDDLERLDYLSFPTLAALDGPKGGRELMGAVAHYGSEVVVIDTVSRAIAGEENENDTWLGFYRHTGLALKQAGVALVRLDHSGKDETKGQRGGSAKSGDVDAVWRLSKITDDSYRLDCEAARMPVVEKTLVLHRHVAPLHHTVDAEGRAAAMRIKVEEVVKVLDAAGAGTDVTNADARDIVRASGLKARNGVIADALKERRLGLWTTVPRPWGTDLENDRSPDDGERWGTED